MCKFTCHENDLENKFVAHKVTLPICTAIHVFIQVLKKHGQND